MDEFLPVVREILKEFLSFSPLKGAKLKPLVVMEFERRTKTSYARTFWKYPKFSDLLKLNEDLVEIDRTGVADIVVRLRSAEAPTAVAGASSHAVYMSTQPYIQPDLWHAFANPDTRRRRFYHRKTAEVVHYVEGNGADAAFEAKVLADPEYVEIKPVPRSDHNAWMKEFVQSNEVPDATRAALLSIASVPYTSQLNRAFGGALEKNADAWRRFRTAKVLDRVKHWAEENGVAVPELIRTQSERAIREAVSMEAVVAPAAAVANLDSRKLLHALVDSLDESDLAHVLIPATVLAKIAAARSQ